MQKHLGCQYIYLGPHLLKAWAAFICRSNIAVTLPTALKHCTSHMHVRFAEDACMFMQTCAQLAGMHS